ncbi:MAG: hypothetical protein AAFQ80_11475 [Cyanobacteria bacterium J06621_8]
MTTTNSNAINSQSVNKPERASNINSLLPDTIEAITPLFIATVGAIIGIVVLVQPAERIDNTRATAGLGLAGTAIAGAAGLARSGKGERK